MKDFMDNMDTDDFIISEVTKGFMDIKDFEEIIHFKIFNFREIISFIACKESQDIINYKKIISFKDIIRIMVIAYSQLNFIQIN